MYIETPVTTVPLRTNATGTVRVGDTRVTLDTVIVAFNYGETPEGIAQNYSSLNLADVYAVIAFYLTHKEAMDIYLSERKQAADEIQQQITASPNYQLWRERLLARQALKQLRA